MALTRLYDFTPGTTIVSSQVDDEFNQILNNALTLISPLTGTLNANNNQISNLRIENVTATPSGSQAGKAVFHTGLAELQIMDGSFVRHVPTTATPSQGALVMATDSGIWGQLAPAAAAGRMLVFGSTLRPAWSDAATGSLATQSGYILTGSATWNPGSIAATTSATTSVSCSGAQVGDPTFVGFSGLGAASNSHQLSGSVVTADAARG